MGPVLNQKYTRNFRRKIQVGRRNFIVVKLCPPYSAIFWWLISNVVYHNANIIIEFLLFCSKWYDDFNEIWMDFWAIPTRVYGLYIYLKYRHYGNSAVYYIYRTVVNNDSWRNVPIFSLTVILILQQSTFIYSGRIITLSHVVHR